MNQIFFTPASTQQSDNWVIIYVRWSIDLHNNKAASTHRSCACTETRLPLQAAAPANQVYIRHVALSPPAGLTLSDTSEYSLSAESASTASHEQKSLMGHFTMYVQTLNLCLLNIFMTWLTWLWTYEKIVASASLKFTGSDYNVPLLMLLGGTPVAPN